MNSTKFNLKDLLEQPIDCPCGRTHSVHIKTVEIKSGALQTVPALVKECGYKKVLVIADCNTHKVAGIRLLELLDSAGLTTISCIFDDSALVPDEKTVGAVLMNFERDCDLIIAVGSGTINDLSRFVSYQLSLPYFIVATAPSMDGYASAGAPLIRNNLKTTFECQMPKAIIADLDILAQAPPRMVAAGFADVVGKFTCLADWKLSNIINDEYYCDYVVEMTRYSLQRIISLQEGIVKGELGAIERLMEALVIAGIAMAYAGNSRPASGSEHHMSHFWEMRFLFDEKPQVLHGTKVGIAAVLTAGLYQRLAQESLTSDQIGNIKPPDLSNWESEIRRVFLAAAPEVLRLEEKVQKNGLEGHAQRIKAIAENWPEILQVLKSVPDGDHVAAILASVGAPTKPNQVGINPELVKEGILYAKEIRPRYTILQLLWDLNVLSAYGQRMTKECDN